MKRGVASPMLLPPGSFTLTCAGANRISLRVKLWRSGIFWTILSFVSGLGNYLFSALIGNRLTPEEFGFTNSTLDFIGFLGLPLQMVSTALVHYIAYFRGKNDDARLRGLLGGCRKFLLKTTIAGSILAIAVADPLAHFFNFPRSSLMLAALICVLVGLWSGFAVALCQGMAWFKRLALITLGAVCLRLLFGWVATKHYPSAGIAVSATTFSLFANLTLLYWWKDIFQPDAETISPWNKEFLGFLAITGATVAATYFFTTGDGLVAKRYFTGADNGAYQAAARLGRAIPQTVGPLLIVMFTSRSGSKEGAAIIDQRILLILFAAGLGCGAAGLIVFRGIFVKFMLKTYNPEAAAMVIPYSITMVLIGLNQAIGMWSLANRWFRMAMIYGSLGVIYWLTLLTVGKTPAALLHIMPIVAAAAFCVLCGSWLLTLRQQQPRPA
jgi:O-antigen/teichoic acid export membrane protein